MRPQYLLLLLITTVFLGCKKQKLVSNTPMPPDPQPPAVLLKEIVIPNLPSPYYHFEYDGEGKAVFASFASELTRYNIFYDGSRIREMRNNILVNKDRVQYVYNGAGNVELIHFSDSTGSVYALADLFYNDGKLVKLDRAKKTAGGFVQDKTITMSYYADGNLSNITYHYYPFSGQPENIFTIHFEQYDNKINVDGFDLLHNEFFEHLFLLPGITIQKNNPGKETRTGDGVNYTVDFTYTYNDKNAPLNKRGNFVYTNGTNAGQTFQTNSFYSYY